MPLPRWKGGRGGFVALVLLVASPSLASSANVLSGSEWRSNRKWLSARALSAVTVASAPRHSAVLQPALPQTHHLTKAPPLTSPPMRLYFQYSCFFVFLVDSRFEPRQALLPNFCSIYCELFSGLLPKMWHRATAVADEWCNIFMFYSTVKLKSFAETWGQSTVISIYKGQYFWLVHVYFKSFKQIASNFKLNWNIACRILAGSIAMHCLWRPIITEMNIRWHAIGSSGAHSPSRKHSWPCDQHIQKQKQPRVPVGWVYSSSTLQFFSPEMK